MAEVDVQHLDGERFAVTIEEKGTKSVHEVTASEKQAGLLCDGCERTKLVEASMQFLLDREPRESIMRQFDLDVIARFFPEYPTAIREYL